MAKAKAQISTPGPSKADPTTNLREVVVSGENEQVVIGKLDRISAGGERQINSVEWISE